ncbi:MAG: phage tail assembly chaperone [Hyphomonadaceae bacterium]|nr:phage tail assembly chaperone [Hyphomonadaceae bacterium]
MIPWRAWLALALSLGLAPEAFWRLSVREWRALTRAPAPLSRTDLEALMRAYPDART